MSLKNDCCRRELTAEADTGEEHQCSVCANYFIWDGERWENIHALGRNKVAKLKKIRKTMVLFDGLVRTSETRF